MARNILVYFLFLVFALVMQGKILLEIFPNIGLPDFFLIVIIAGALKFQRATALVIAFVCGMLADFSSGIVVGPQAAGGVIACIFTQTFSKNIFIERYISVAIIAAGAVVLKEIVSNWLMVIFSETESLSSRFSYVVSILPYEIIFTALVAPICLKFLLKKALRNV